MPEYLKREECDALMAWPTPAISNAVELFDIRKRNEGFMLPQIKCRFPHLKPMIGYAVTGLFLGLAYFDLYYALIAILVVTKDLLNRELEKEKTEKEELSKRKGPRPRRAAVPRRIAQQPAAGR